MIFRKLLLLFFFFSYFSFGFSQNATIDSLLALSETKEEEEKVKILKKVFFLQFYTAPQEAKKTAHRTWRIAKSSTNKRVRAAAASSLVITYSLLAQKHDSAVYWADRSIKLHQQTGDSVAISQDLHNIGVSHWMNNRYDSGLYYYLESTNIIENLSLPKELVSSYANIGIAYQTLKKYKKGFEYLQKSLELASQHSSPEFVMQVQLNISKSYKNIGKLDSASWYAKKALKIANDIESSVGLHHIYVTLASYNYSVKNYEKGIEYIIQSVKIPSHLKDPTYSMESEYVHAKLLIGLHKYIEAKDIALRGIKLSKNTQTKNDAILVQLYQLMPIIYSYLEQPNKVTTFMEKFISLSDSIDATEILTKTSELQTEYETEKKEQKIKELEQEKEIEKLEIETLQKQRTILALSFLAPLSFIFAGGWYVNRRRLKLQLEAEQRERAKQISELKALRSQMNPHFIFNALNSIQDFIMLSEKENAQHYLGKFAILMRGFLDSSSKSKISLEKELPLIKSYIELEGLRLGEEFSYEINFDSNIDEDELDEIEIPPLLIQPYLENAFKHGLLHKQGEKKLTLDFDKIEKSDEQFLQLKITDNGVGRQKSAEINERKRKTHNSTHTSFATQATQERLELLKSQSVSNATIEVEINDLQDNQGNAKGTEIIILIPMNNY
ncbi:histidine kinase [Bernardetia sp. ABR2-2B]|uniref:tetratricopeptide repeat-containing sensor histidine kinase n=1 Tax=Bernardetia sp. ABR2-2B TaxID=3127472 RepID=UPI0030CCE93F